MEFALIYLQMKSRREDYSVTLKNNMKATMQCLLFILSTMIYAKFCMSVLIKSTKTTSLEDVSTGVLKKNKEHLSSKDKAKKWYDVSRHI